MLIYDIVNIADQIRSISLAPKFQSHFFSRGSSPIIGNFGFVWYHSVEFFTSIEVFGTRRQFCPKRKNSRKIKPCRISVQSLECSSDASGEVPAFPSLLLVPFNRLSKSSFILGARKFSQSLNGKYFISRWWKVSGPSGGFETLLKAIFSMTKAGLPHHRGCLLRGRWINITCMTLMMQSELACVQL